MGTKQPYIPPLIGWLYDLVLWTFSVLIDLFFREVHPRGSWKIPRRGPMIIVAAPHANQVCTPYSPLNWLSFHAGYNS